MPERPGGPPSATGRLWPSVWLLCAAALGVFALIAMGYPAADDQPVLDGITTLLPFPVTFALGLSTPRWLGLAATLALATCIEINQGYLNPFVLVITIGAWVPGMMIRDRRQAAHELAELTQQLEIEADLFAEETVRLERARIAHELHDIVAHSVSVMVVQAYAGSRLLHTDHAAAVEALDQIGLAATQARQEIGHLVDLLAVDGLPAGMTGLSAGLAELVATASATGIEVRLRAPRGLDALPAPVASAAYRIVQESITNALRHGPGASIEVHVTREPDALYLTVTNGPTAPDADTPLTTSGGGRGVTGMGERATAVGGYVRAGAHRTGWRVSARLPLPAPAD
jgi:signal transduction histidine kinase